MSILSTERGPSYLTFKHDCPQTPPVTIRSISIPGENLRSNVIRCPDRRVSHDPTWFPPVVYGTSVSHCEVNLIQSDGVPVSWPVWFALEEVLVIGVVMQLMEASRESKIGELDMATTVQKNVIRFDITITKSTVIPKRVRRILPVDESIFMNSFDSEHDFRNVEPGDVFRKDFILDQHCHEIASRQKLHQHIKEIGILKGGV